jgi:hypothetical protein
VDVAVRLECAGAAIEAQLKSLSRMGALVEVQDAYPQGAAVTLHLDLPDTEDETLLRGEVIRSMPAGASQAVAIFFGPLAWDTLVRLTAFLSLYPPPD